MIGLVGRELLRLVWWLVWNGLRVLVIVVFFAFVVVGVFGWHR